MSIGRNDLCPCGSGKKYKKCCLDKNEKVRAVLVSERRKLTKENLQQYMRDLGACPEIESLFGIIKDEQKEKESLKNLLEIADKTGVKVRIVGEKKNE